MTERERAAEERSFLFPENGLSSFWDMVSF